MIYAQKITRLRGRGQLTVPQEIRQALQWPDDEELPVKVETTRFGFKVERLPIAHPQNARKKLTQEESNNIWEEMKKISYAGKQHVNLTDFLRHDRDTHV